MNILSFENRVNFYLGYELINLYPLNINMIDLSNEKIITILNLNDCANYDNPLKMLLQKTNNSTKKFIYTYGDIQHITSLISLGKNRCDGNNNSVILRCLEHRRHWENYYKPPKLIDFNKKISKVFWRGTTTGNQKRIGNRFDMITKWFNKSNNIDVGFSKICQNQHTYSDYVKGSCDITTFLKYKYILSIEGNDKDSGINWKLNSNSLVLMTKPRVCSWLMETTLIPDYHYIILKDDFSDLEEKVNWCNNNPHICKSIINNANKFMSQFKDETIENKIEEAVINKYFDIIKSLNL